MGKKHGILAVFFLFISFTMGPSGKVWADISAAERSALTAFYESTEGMNWENSGGWNGPPGTECSWFGVKCDVLRNRVISLCLPDNGLKGPLPEKMGDLSHLLYLNLESNALSAFIPAALSRLKKLVVLNLESNELHGKIPLEIGTMKNLEELYLGLNRLEGKIPRQLGNLRQLRILDLGANRLQGAPPPELGSLLHLEELYLEMNRLSGPLHGNIINSRKLRIIRYDSGMVFPSDSNHPPESSIVFSRPEHSSNGLSESSFGFSRPERSIINRSDPLSFSSSATGTRQ